MSQGDRIVSHRNGAEYKYEIYLRYVEWAGRESNTARKPNTNDGTGDRKFDVRQCRSEQVGVIGCGGTGFPSKIKHRK